jgi:hypothetical protein
MTNWILCAADFINHDHVRWKEPKWKDRTSKKAKARVIGDREIIAEVLAIDAEDWVTLLVISCVTKRREDWIEAIPELKPNEVITRRRQTIGKGDARRRLWEDESNRDIVRSRHTGPEPAHSPHAITPRGSRPEPRKPSRRGKGPQPRLRR